MRWWRIRQNSAGGGNYVANGDINVINNEIPPVEASHDEPDEREIKGVADRILQVFTWHGIKRGEIPKFLNQFGGPPLSFGALSSTKSLIDNLEDAHIDFIREFFSLNINWLRSDDATSVLPYEDFYKSLHGFPRFLLVESVRNVSGKGLWSTGFDRTYPSGTVYFFASKEPSIEAPSDNDSGSTSVGAVFKVKIGDFEGRSLYRYIPMKPLPWSYWPARYHTVGFMSIADRCNLNVLGVITSSNEDTYAICQGRRFPVEIANDIDYQYDRSWEPKYPFLGYSQRAQNPRYQEYWRKYYAEFSSYDLEMAIEGAVQERRTQIYGPINDEV